MYRLESQSVAFFVLWARRKVDLFSLKFRRELFFFSVAKEIKTHAQARIFVCAGFLVSKEEEGERVTEGWVLPFVPSNKATDIKSSSVPSVEKEGERVPPHPPPVHFFCILLFFLGGCESSRCEHLSAVFHGFLCWWEITEFSSRSNRGRLIARSNVQKRTWDKIQPRVDL